MRPALKVLAILWAAVAAIVRITADPNFERLDDPGSDLVTEDGAV